MNEFDNQIVLITGAKGGLGSSVTEAYLREGATVIGVARSIAQADFASPCFHAMPTDLTREESVLALGSQVHEQFGRVDVLAHLMGGYEGGTAAAETPQSSFEKMFVMNFWPAVHLAKAFVPRMREKGKGRVLAVGARPALEPVATLGAYSASKAALVSLMRTLSLENKDRGITVNLILPGMMDTPANRAAMPGADFSKWVQPAKVASLALWLTSEAASQVTGALVPMYDGGA